MSKRRAVRDLADPSLHPDGKTDPPNQSLPGFAEQEDPVAAAAARYYFDELPPGAGDPPEAPAAGPRSPTGTVALRWEVWASLDQFLRLVVAHGVTAREAALLVEAHEAILRAVAGHEGR